MSTKPANAHKYSYNKTK